MNLNETSIPTNYVFNLGTRHGLELTPEETARIYEVMVKSMATYAGIKKAKDKPVAITVSDLKGNFKLGAIVQYHENENSDLPGNWTLEFTFNEEDVKDKDTFPVMDSVFEVLISEIAFKDWGIRFVTTSYLHAMLTTAVEVLYDFLDQNTTEENTCEVVLPGSFTANGAVEDGIKVFSFTPDGSIKRIIKDDSNL